LDPVHRHRCLIYDGAPSRYLPALAAVMREQLRAGTRCLYLNSPTMVSGMQSYLAAAGVDVAHEIAKGSLIVSSDRPHLTGTRFDIGRMIGQLEDAISQALNEGPWALGYGRYGLGAWPRTEFQPTAGV
jgi:hypothetical protein